MPRNFEDRDRKLKKRTQGMKVSNKGIFVVQDSQRKRDERKAREFLRKKKGSEEKRDEQDR